MPAMFSISSAAWPAMARPPAVGEGDGHGSMIGLGPLNDLELGHRIPQIVLEALVDLGDVRPGLAQEGGGLKGTAAGAHGKALGIQHDARQDRLRLHPFQVAGIQDILDQLRHQLAGGGGVGSWKLRAGFSM